MLPFLLVTVLPTLAMALLFSTCTAAPTCTAVPAEIPALTASWRISSLLRAKTLTSFQAVISPVSAFTFLLETRVTTAAPAAAVAEAFKPPASQRLILCVHRFEVQPRSEKFICVTAAQLPAKFLDMGVGRLGCSPDQPSEAPGWPVGLKSAPRRPHVKGTVDEIFRPPLSR